MVALGGIDKRKAPCDEGGESDLGGFCNCWDVQWLGGHVYGGIRRWSS
jgi:hypothetical protein